jgi:diguanylate cyclase (GGDEF)-like protein
VLSVILGIPEEQLTPQVRTALERLIADAVARQEEILRRSAHETFLDDQSHHCDRTGLLNRRGLSRELGRISAHIAQGGEGGTLVLLHLDNQESFRRSQGLLAADSLSRHVAGVLASGLRQSDVAAALGGGDYAIFLALCRGEEAEVKAGALATRINSPAFQWLNQPHTFTIAIGFADLEPDSSLESLLSQADQDLRPAGFTL